MRREKTDQWVTSDGQTWRFWHEANAHEKFICMRQIMTQVMMTCTSPDQAARYMLSQPNVTIFVTPLKKESPR